MAQLQGLPDRPALSIHRGDETAPRQPLGPRRLAGPVGGVLFGSAACSTTTPCGGGGWCAVLRQFHVTTSFRCFSRVWERDFLVHVQCGRQTFSQAFRAYMTAIGLAAAQIDELEAAAHAQRRHLETGIRPLPGVKSTLARLQQSGLPLAVLANCELDGAGLAQQLGRIGLEGLFAAVLTSRELQRAKPDPATYRAAAQALGLPVERIAFVGHDTEELAGARAVGMPTVAFNFDADAQADVFLARFDRALGHAGRPPQPGEGGLNRPGKDRQTCESSSTRAPRWSSMPRRPKRPCCWKARGPTTPPRPPAGRWTR